MAGKRAAGKNRRRRLRRDAERRDAPGYRGGYCGDADSVRDIYFFVYVCVCIHVHKRGKQPKTAGASGHVGKFVANTETMAYDPS